MESPLQRASWIAVETFRTKFLQRKTSNSDANFKHSVKIFPHERRSNMGIQHCDPKRKNSGDPVHQMGTFSITICSVSIAGMSIKHFLHMLSRNFRVHPNSTADNKVSEADNSFFSRKRQTLRLSCLLKNWKGGTVTGDSSPLENSYLRQIYFGRGAKILWEVEKETQGERNTNAFGKIKLFTGT